MARRPHQREDPTMTLRARAVLFDAHQRAPREGREDQPALAVKREAVGADHGEFLEAGIAAVEAVVLNAAPAPYLRPGVADIAGKDGGLAVRRELPHDVAGNIGEQQIAGRASC